MPTFDEKDPATFFTLLERVAGSRGSECTLLLKCVFAGIAQEADCADSESYLKV